MRRCNSASVVASKMMDRRSRGAEFPNSDAEASGFVGQVVLDSRAREVHDADWQQLEHGVVPSEWCGLRMLGPVGLEGDLRDLAGVCPAGGDAFSTFRGTAMQEHHVGMLGTRLIELCPDPLMIVIVHAAGKRDLGARRNQYLGFGAAAGGEEVAAVDHRRRHGGVVDLRAGARPPG